MPKLSPELRSDYQKKFDECIITNIAEIDNSIKKILNGKSEYDNVSATTSVPWYVIGIIHNLECNSNFETHLFNGDPLSARTVHEPIGMPKVWNPPNDWASSAVAALEYDKFTEWKDWSIPGILYKFEGYNGWGYYINNYGPSPYLWSFSQWYTKGKFDKDGHYNPDLVSDQCGAAVILKRMTDLKKLT